MAVAGPEVEPGAKTAEAARTRRGPGRRGAALRLGLMAVPFAFFGLFFAYPVTAIVGRGLKAGGDWQFGRIGDVLARPDILDVLWFTTWQALASTALTLLIALPGAYAFARFDFPGKQLLRAVVTVPFVLPTVVVGTAFLALLGRGGLLDELWGVRLDTTVWAILLAHVFFNYAVVVRTVGGLWSQLDPRQEEAARVLGAGRFAAFRRVTLPALGPAVAAAALMVFLFTFTSFGVVQILGGPAYSTLEVEIYRQTAQLLDLPTAAVLTLVQFAAVGAILAVHAATVRRRERALKLVDPDLTSHAAARSRTVGTARRCPPHRAAADPAAAGGAGGALLRWSRRFRRVRLRLLPGPPVGRVRRLLHLPGPAAGGRRQLPAVRARRDAHRSRRRRPRGGGPDPTGRAAGPRLRRAADAAARGVRRHRRLRLPDHSGRAAARPADLLDPGPPGAGPGRRPLRRTDHAARAARGRRPAAGGRRRAGGLPLRAWREVDLPLVRRAVLVAAGFAFAVSLGEFGATVFIARPDNPTLPVAVARLLGRSGELNYGQAMALSTILMLVCAVSLLLLERIRTDRSGEF